MAWHELAHALAHTALGGRVLELHLGGSVWSWGRLRLGWKPWQGRVHYDPRFRLPVRDRMLVTAAGPLANLLLAGAGFSLAALHPSGALTCVAGLSLLVGLLNLLPVLQFDGRRLLEYGLRLAGVSQSRAGQVLRSTELGTCVVLSVLALVLLGGSLLH